MSDTASDVIGVIKYTFLQMVVLLPVWFIFYTLKDSILFINTGVVFFPLIFIYPACFLILRMCGNCIEDWGILIYILFYLLLLIFGCYILTGIPSLLDFITLYW